MILSMYYTLKTYSICKLNRSIYTTTKSLKKEKFTKQIQVLLAELDRHGSFELIQILQAVNLFDFDLSKVHIDIICETIEQKIDEFNFTELSRLAFLLSFNRQFDRLYDLFMDGLNYKMDSLVQSSKQVNVLDKLTGFLEVYMSLLNYKHKGSKFRWLELINNSLIDNLEYFGETSRILAVVCREVRFNTQEDKEEILLEPNFSNLNFLEKYLMYYYYMGNEKDYTAALDESNFKRFKKELLDFERKSLKHKKADNSGVINKLNEYSDILTKELDVEHVLDDFVELKEGFWFYSPLFVYETDTCLLIQKEGEDGQIKNDISLMLKLHSLSKAGISLRLLTVSNIEEEVFLQNMTDAPDLAAMREIRTFGLEELFNLNE